LFNDLGLQLQAALAAEPPPESLPSTAVAPRIAGTPAAGQALTAFPGVWTNAPEGFSYQWQRCTPACDPIPGATGRTYAVTVADQGVQLAVSVTAQNAAGIGTASALAAAPMRPPVGVTAPAVSGVPAVGAMLTADAGTWDGDPTAFQYQWLRCATSCTPILGATATAYTATSADHGAALAVTVTASNGGGSASQTSAPTTVVVAAPSNTSKPTISGKAKVGATLTAQPGTWTDAPTAYAYQWQRCSSKGCTNIIGATSPAYTPTRADKGHPLRVAVTATNAAGSATANSAKTNSIKS
jgi:hypothetical protein